jgi:hypothetical protein
MPYYSSLDINFMELLHRCSVLGWGLSPLGRYPRLTLHCQQEEEDVLWQMRKRIPRFSFASLV